MAYATLPDRGLLAVGGEDRIAFLQGLVSNDVLKLARQGILYAALLTPQGKFLHDFFLMERDGAVWIDADAARLEDLLQRLTRYRLRSKVSFERMDNYGVAAVWDKDAPAAAGGVVVYRDPRLTSMGYRMIGPKDALPQRGQDDYESHRIALGVPQGGSDLIPDKSFILHFGFEALHGVDFNKGCYVGQEVTARSKHLGRLRKAVYRVEGDTALPAAGTAVHRGNIAAGELRSVKGTLGIALLNIEEVEKPAALRCGDVPIRVSVPEWMTPEKQ